MTSIALDYSYVADHFTFLPISTEGFAPGYAWYRSVVRNLFFYRDRKEKLVYLVAPYSFGWEDDSILLPCETV
jgi:hypothetical protein